MNPNYEKYTKKYEKLPKGKFIRQRANARQRGVGWELTFEQWWDLWEKSGKWEQRGKRSKEYCMARKLDDGPYSLENVYITTNKKNSQEAFFHEITT